MNVAQIVSPLPREHLAATAPKMLRELEPDWRQRLNFWAGRALTAEALEIEQEHHAAHLAWQGRVPTPGIVTGLEVALEGPATPSTPLKTAGHFIHVLPGHGFTVYGEDVMVPRPLRIPLEEIPVRYVRVTRPGQERPDEAAASGTTSTPLEFGGMRLEIDDFGAGYVPWAAVLVARPAELRAFGNLDPDDPCEIDLSRDAFADERRLDAATFWLFQLPVSFENDPLLAARGDLTWRNRLAHAIFDAERIGAARQFIRFLASGPKGDRWDTVREENLIFPWELFGVPVALLSSAGSVGSQQFFLDRATVARLGGRARTRSRTVARLATEENDAALHPLGAGTPALWRAQVDQFAEHLSTFADVDSAQQADHFRFVPPAGLLSSGALDFLTTKEAQDLGVLDRAATSKFFPQAFAVEAVPIPIECLDAELAASAPLASFDVTVPDMVRVLVPLAQSVFDPQLLVVEKIDPFFATEIARLVAGRQDWRQRRDLVRARRDAWQALISGPTSAVVRLAQEPDQLEPEPVEDVSHLGFDDALVSPLASNVAREISIDLLAKPNINSEVIFYIDLRLDLAEMPDRIEGRWRVDGKDFSISKEFPPPICPALTTSVGPPPMPLWRRFTITAGHLGIRRGKLERFTLHIDNGRAALGALGTKDIFAPPPDEGSGFPFIPAVVVWTEQPLRGLGAFDPPLWKVGDGAPLTFVGGDWTPLGKKSPPPLLAPFEPLFEPLFPDGLDLDKRLKELPTVVLVQGEPRQDAAAIGLVRLIERLDQQLNRADDFVDLWFLKTQTNTHRIRQVLLGNQVADDLLISPVLSSVVQRSSARAVEEDLLSALRSTPAEALTTETPSPTLRARTTGAAGARAAAMTEAGIKFGTAPGFNLSAALEQKPFELFPSKGVSILVKPPTGVADVIHADPAIGKGFELRTLSIAKRFDAGPVLTAYDYADAGLRDIISHLPEFDLDFDEKEFIPDTTLDDKPVTFRDVATIKNFPIEKLVFAEPISDANRRAAGADTGSFLAKGVRRADATVLVLRRLEFYIARRRALLVRANEVLAELRRQLAAAEGRLTVIAGPLAEARHDVSVARALLQEEQERLDGINTRRDALIRDEVKFLAYVRPRTVDLVRRNLPGWKLESADTPAPVPACLQRHDQPPDPLRAYVQLFRNAPAAWFTDIAPRLRELDTPEKLSELLAATQRSALVFSTEKRLAFATNITSVATQNTLRSAFSIVDASRARAASQLVRPNLRSWNDYYREVQQHSSLGDIIDGRHGHPALARAAADVLQKIEEVATCLHAEFAAVPAAIRLVWVERYSQFDQPAPLNNMTLLPRYGSLDRATRRRFQAFSDWLFGRVNTKERDAFNLINDLVRICLLLASHAPVKSLIAGHLPRPVPVRPGVLIPIVAFDQRLVRVGMEVHVWREETLVASARVEDLKESEIYARIARVELATTTLDPTMRVQFVPSALGFSAPLQLA